MCLNKYRDKPGMFLLRRRKHSSSYLDYHNQPNLPQRELNLSLTPPQTPPFTHVECLCVSRIVHVQVFSDNLSSILTYPNSL